MKRFALPLAAAASITACARPDIGPEPSLAPRAAEAIDPRVAIPSDVPMGSVDAGLASRLAALVGEARAAAPMFSALHSDVERLAAAAGPAPSESWVAAQQALSRLVGQHGVTAQIAADIDEIAATQVKEQRWIAPANREAIAAAAAEVRTMSEAQTSALHQLRERLSN